MAKNKYIKEPIAGRSSRALKEAKQEHKDVVVRNVLVCINGNWSKFDNLLKAKTILLPENHESIYINPEDMYERCPKKYYERFERDFGLDTIHEVWDHIWNTSKNPYSTVDRYRELDDNPAFKPLKTRNKRKLNYRIVFNPEDEKQLGHYYNLPPQARAVLDIMHEATVAIEKLNPGKTAIFEELELQEIIEKQKERLETRQSSWRIFQYYRGKLIQHNFLRYAK